MTRAAEREGPEPSFHTVNVQVNQEQGQEDVAPDLPVNGAVRSHPNGQDLTEQETQVGKTCVTECKWPEPDLSQVLAFGGNNQCPSVINWLHPGRLTNLFCLRILILR